MKRRGFLGTLGATLSFSVFEKMVMAEVGVKTPTDITKPVYMLNINYEYFKDSISIDDLVMEDIEHLVSNNLNSIENERLKIIIEFFNDYNFIPLYTWNNRPYLVIKENISKKQVLDFFKNNKKFIVDKSINGYFFLARTEDEVTILPKDIIEIEKILHPILTVTEVPFDANGIYNYS